MLTLPACAAEVLGWGNNSRGQATVPAGLRVRAVDAGAQHSLVLLEDGSLLCWGDNMLGQTNVPSGLPPAVAISTLGDHSLALLSDGRIVAWGDNSRGQCNVPQDLQGVVDIAAGGNFSAALLSNGTVRVWGLCQDTFLEQAAGITQARKLVAGENHVLALREDSTVTLAGNLFWGDMYGATTNVPPDLTNVVAIAAGSTHNVVLRADHTLVAWGFNSSGQCSIPGNLTNVVAIAAAGDTTMVLRDDRTLMGWGYGGAGLLTLPPGLTNVSLFTLGYAHGLAVGERVPVITQQPASVTKFSGTTVTLQVAASGTPPLTWQWWRSEPLGPIPGATNASLVLADAKVPDSGAYFAVASNWLDQAVSSNAVLTVVDSAPRETQPPPTIVGTPNRTDNLRVNVEGSLPMSFEWTYGPGLTATSSVPELSIGSASEHLVGPYFARVSNAHGTITTSSGYLGYAPIAIWGTNQPPVSVVPLAASNAVAVSAGRYFNLALRPDGKVVGWGTARSVQVPANLTNAVAICAGYDHALAIRADGTLTTWGTSQSTLTRIPASATDVQAIAAGYNFSLALRRDGTVVAWGENTYGQLNIPPGLGDVVAITAGFGHSVALRRNGTVVAWGYGFYGETNVPPGLDRVISIASGAEQNFALRDDGTYMTWGWPLSTNRPVQFPEGLGSVAAFAGGTEHSLALRTDGSVVAWGSNRSGQTNVPPLPPVVAISSRDTHCLALVGDGKPVIVVPARTLNSYSGDSVRLAVTAAGPGVLEYQWYRNGVSLTGETNALFTITNAPSSASGEYTCSVRNQNGSTTSRPVAVDLPDTAPFAEVLPTALVTWPGSTVRLQASVVGSWPRQIQWYRGTEALPGMVADTLLLQEVTAAQSGFYRVAATNAFGGELSSAGRLCVVPLVAWGRNWSGQTNIPTALDGQEIVSVAAKASYSLALLGDGSVVGWGEDVAGVLSPPPSCTNVIAIAAGARHAVALRADRTVVAWGDPDGDRLVAPEGLSDVVAITCGENHSVALRADGSVVSWGVNPATPLGLTNIVAVAAGSDFSLTLSGDGTVQAWRSVPDSSLVPPVGLSNVVAIAAGYAHVLALKRDGSVATWGYDPNGVLVVPANLPPAIGIGTSGGCSVARLADGTMRVWGSNFDGLPNVPPGLGRVIQVAGGGGHLLALLGLGDSAPPSVHINTLADDVKLSVSTRRGRASYLESTDRLDGSANWQILKVLPGDGSQQTATVPRLGADQRFYRVRQE